MMASGSESVCLVALRCYSDFHFLGGEKQATGECHVSTVGILRCISDGVHQWISHR